MVSRPHGVMLPALGRCLLTGLMSLQRAEPRFPSSSSSGMAFLSSLKPHLSFVLKNSSYLWLATILLPLCLVGANCHATCPCEDSPSCHPHLSWIWGLRLL